MKDVLLKELFKKILLTYLNAGVLNFLALDPFQILVKLTFLAQKEIYLNV